eukprot:CAMPEP_0204898560 /NCGR_PEP_ID=MMETSP1397-20131031/1368_1 /ASSEMBLY_ACC=CAM_ASM_000891 /TAXON_ID=49980 /ORGANISM="Climacostomum Climacostomum virens, Strain Stock W-24" /LENGTH=770 /DNA_ID=CAMNT_0052066435 /DNA_START=14 /DNA_END=2326 /DNA_ORIENTATION=-
MASYTYEETMSSIEYFDDISTERLEASSYSPIITKQKTTPPPFPLDVTELISFHHTLSRLPRRHLRDALVNVVYGSAVSNSQQPSEALEKSSSFIKIFKEEASKSLIPLASPQLTEVGNQTEELTRAMFHLKQEVQYLRLRSLRTLLRSDERNQMVANLKAIRQGSYRHLMNSQQVLLLVCCRVIILSRASVSEQHSIMKWRLVNQLCKEYENFRLGKFAKASQICEKYRLHQGLNSFFDSWKPYHNKKEQELKRKSLMQKAIYRAVCHASEANKSTALLKWRLVICITKKQTSLTKLSIQTLQLLDKVFSRELSDHIQAFVNRRLRSLAALELSNSPLRRELGLTESFRLKSQLDTFIESVECSKEQLRQSALKLSCLLICLTLKQNRRELTRANRATSELKASYRLRFWYSSWRDCTVYMRSIENTKQRILGFLAQETLLSSFDSRKRQSFKVVMASQPQNRDASYMSRIYDKLLKETLTSVRVAADAQVKLIKYNEYAEAARNPYQPLVKIQEESAGITRVGHIVGHYEITLKRCYTTWSYASKLNRSENLCRGLSIELIVTRLLRRRLNGPFKSMTSAQLTKISRMVSRLSMPLLLLKQSYFIKFANNSRKTFKSEFFSGQAILARVANAALKAGFDCIVDTPTTDHIRNLKMHMLGKVSLLRLHALSKWRAHILKADIINHAGRIALIVDRSKLILKDAMRVWSKYRNYDEDRSTVSEHRFKHLPKEESPMHRLNPSFVERLTIPIFPKIEKSRSLVKKGQFVFR